MIFNRKVIEGSSNLKYTYTMSTMSNLMMSTNNSLTQPPAEAAPLVVPALPLLPQQSPDGKASLVGGSADHQHDVGASVRISEALKLTDSAQRDAALIAALR